eukprot:4816776-Pyramimonas_sp.AAC.1
MHPNLARVAESWIPPPPPDDKEKVKVYKQKQWKRIYQLAELIISLKAAGKSAAIETTEVSVLKAAILQLLPQAEQQKSISKRADILKEKIQSVEKQLGELVNVRDDLHKQFALAKEQLSTFDHDQNKHLSADMDSHMQVDQDNVP